ncbi:PTS glucose transporter subunit IIA [Acetonema longum]|uniref:PTS system, glucose subfamily, IIA subunit n=1 Tax=Acetonema longum DSM 6540 TaxID=1009370 RepID=F7NJ47_9FIRM|nr:PTS glucose transporter subunit IIA [Acetonema longum]EGO63937.1 PTS system, glucose subfamily, IIA subunit [Acetonema longum DSM 6540]
MFGIFSRKKAVEFKAPVSGTAMDLTTVPDDVFAQKMVGDGLAFEPSEGVLHAPVDGQVVQVSPTKHAIGLRTKEGLEVLIHIGIDTVDMKGEGFESLVTAGQTVRTGDQLMTFDRELIRQKAKSTMIPMIITNMDHVRKISVTYGPVDLHSAVMNVEAK